MRIVMAKGSLRKPIDESRQSRFGSKDPLSGIAAPVEKFLLLRRHISAKNWIAVGKAAEALHDVAMPLGLHGVWRLQWRAQPHRPLLIGQILGMAKGQIEKRPQLPRHHLVVARVD